MPIKKSKLRWTFEVCNTVVLLLLVLCTLYPLIYVLFASVSESDALTRHGGALLFRPLGFTWDAYRAALRNPNIPSGYLNTLFVVVFGVAVSMVLTAIGAYFLSRKGPFWVRPVSLLILFTMWFSGGLIPFYLAVREIGLTGSLWSLILPTAINTYNMIILRTAFASLPDSMEESARIDGAGHLTILWKIILPLSKATLAVIALYYGVSYWNGWFNASIFLMGESDKWPLQLVLRQVLIVNDTSSMTQGMSLSDQGEVGESIKHAIIVIATVPILCVYPFIQKYFVRGVMIGAVKG